MRETTTTKADDDDDSSERRLEKNGPVDHETFSIRDSDTKHIPADSNRELKRASDVTY